MQSNARPMGWLFVKRRMTTELSQRWQDSFIDFDKEAVGYDGIIPVLLDVKLLSKTVGVSPALIILKRILSLYLK